MAGATQIDTGSGDERAFAGAIEWPGWLDHAWEIEDRVGPQA